MSATPAELRRPRLGDAGQLLLRARPRARAVRRCLFRSIWSAFSRPSTSTSPSSVAICLHQLAGELGLLVDRQAEAQAELGVVLEEAVRPGRPAAVLVHRPRRRRQVAAVDRGAAGGVGDDGAVAEELADQLDVGRLAAAGARAGELEERLEQLRVLDVVQRDHRAIQFRQIQEELEVVALGEAERRLRRHVDRLELGLALVLGRAGVDAQRRSRCSLRAPPGRCTSCRADRGSCSPPT